MDSDQRPVVDRTRGLASYFRSISDTFLEDARQVTHFTSHSLTVGTGLESLFRNVLRRHLPGRLAVGHGFLHSGESDCSRQCDVVIYDDQNYGHYLKAEEFVVVPEPAVVSVIELKSDLRSSRQFEGAVQNLKLASFMGNYRTKGDCYKTHISTFLYIFADVPLTRLQQYIRQFPWNKIPHHYFTSVDMELAMKVMPMNFPIALFTHGGAVLVFRVNRKMRRLEYGCAVAHWKATRKSPAALGFFLSILHDNVHRWMEGGKAHDEFDYRDAFLNPIANEIEWQQFEPVEIGAVPRALTKMEKMYLIKEEFHDAV